MLQLNTRNVAKSRYIIKLLRSKRRCDERFRKVHRSSSISGLRNQAMTTNHLTDHDVFASTSINELFSPQNQPEQNEINEYMGIPPIREQPKKTTYTSKFVREMSTNPKFLFNFVQTCIHVGLPSDAISTVITKLDQSAPSVDHKLLTYMMRWIADLPPSNQLPLHNDITSPLSMNLILLEKIRESGLQPSAASCACVLASLQKFQCNNKHLVKKMTAKFCETFTFDELLDGCTVGGDTYKFCHLAIQTLFPTFQHSPKPPLDGSNPLTRDLSGDVTNTSIKMDLVNRESLDNFFKEQLKQEFAGKENIPNVLLKNKSKQSKKVGKKQAETELLHKMWETKLLAAFNQLKSTERDKFNKYAQRRSSGVFPFLCALPDDVFVDIIMTSMKSLPSSGNIAFVLCCQLGQEVYSRYVISQRHERGHYSELSNIYSKYMEIYTNDRCNLSPRHLWTLLQKELEYINHRDPISPWQNLWIFTIGFKLLEVMVSTLTFDLHRPGGVLRNIPAVFNTYKVYGGKMYGMTIPHPAYVDLMKMAKNDFEFETSILPMVVPPLPWINPGQGGFLVAPTKLIRSYHDVIGRDDDMVEQTNVAAVTDALNILGSVGWRINQRVLDVQLHLFRNKGDKSLAIPPPASEAPVTPDLSGLGELPSSEQRALYEAARTSKKLRSEMSSLHADSLYKLSIANHYRDRIIWFPHNLDFRGRTYPVPRHLNYMGSDVSRSLFLFADGKPLGGSGLDWMKIHLINLTGTKKKEGVQARLDYANEVMEDILDSADHPLEGRGWWRLSDEPWQTLAACMALADAVRSRCPQEFVCHLPIYQDGSCNGLQHYAALGRDSLGAQQVNLAPSSVPQDIYSGVADKVEERRALDAAKGLEIAKILEGFVTRQVIKQTVMTTVYGVTRYGGSLQVQRQLLYLDDFPKKHVGKASSYLVASLFQSINEIFTGAGRIQKWFTDLARCVSRGGDSLEWETPLGLLVTQPYLNTEIHRMDSQVQRMSYARTTPTPNTRKQSNAFPPNFIHSLDSTHMMLTALYCHRAGIKFSAVHDCYWTHACDVDNMNIICRDQFVKLHSQPILEQLAAHLHKFLPSHKADSAVITSEQPLLRDLLNNIPPKGDFDLTEVNKSVFFFS